MSGGDHLPLPPDPVLRHFELGSTAARGLSGSIALYVIILLYYLARSDFVACCVDSESMIKARLNQGCPVCHNNGEGRR